MFMTLNGGNNDDDRNSIDHVEMTRDNNKFIGNKNNNVGNLSSNSNNNSDDRLLDEFIAKRLKGEDPTGGSSTANDNMITIGDDGVVNNGPLSLTSLSPVEREDDDSHEITVNENGDFVFQSKAVATRTAAPASVVNGEDSDNNGSCCLCRGCACSCHVLDEHSLSLAPDIERPIDSYVVYLFDYELFTVPQNYNKFEILYDYLNEERIFDRSYVVSVATDTRRDDYSFYARDASNRNKGSTVESKLERSEVDVNVLRYRPSIVESVDETRNDIRQRFRGLIVQGSRHDWFTVKSVLNYPSFIVYVRVLNSKNNLPSVDHTIVVDPSHKSFISSPGTQGLKIARILAHTRSKYFGIEHFNFTPLLEQSNLRIIQRSVAAANRK